MCNLQITTATEYKDAVIISEQIEEIWLGKKDQNEYDKMFTYMNRFNRGFLIAYLAGKPIGSSIGFPLDHTPTFDEVNTKNIYDMVAISGKFYYIHIIQILSEYRNKGFGIKLLKHQLKTARQNNSNHVTAMGIDREIDLWKRCGFQDFGEFGQYRTYGRMKWLKMELD